MKRLVNLLIILAVLIAPVNFVKATTAASQPVCQIKANVLTVENNSDFYSVNLDIVEAFILMGAEYGDCSYVQGNITARYLLSEYERLPLYKDQQLIAKVESKGDGLMLSEAVVINQNIKNPEVIVQNSQVFNLTKDEVWDGQKYRVFDNKFVFQIDNKMINSAADLELKEIILPPNSIMAPQNGFMLASKVYEYDLKTANEVDLGEALWLSIKYESDHYFRKNIYYFDESKKEWVGLEGIIKNGDKKIVVNLPFQQAKVAILEDIDIMTTGTASWYKYKGCDCAASPDYPKGTKLKVTNVDNGKSVIVKVNDWGPDRSIHPDRVIDLDAVAFKKIGSTRLGLCQVAVELVE